QDPGTNRYDWNGLGTGGTALPDGSYTYNAQVTDSSNSMVTVPFIVDSTPPVIQANVTTVSLATTPITVNVLDPTGLSSATAVVSGDAPVTATIAGRGASFTLVRKRGWTPGDKADAIEISATDGSGNHIDKQLIVSFLTQPPQGKVESAKSTAT